MDISSAYTGNPQPTCQEYQLITSCPANKDVNCTRNSSFDRIPVTDEETGVHFVNGKCAACNGVRRGKMWDAKIYCHNDENSTLTRDISSGNGTLKTVSRESLLNLLEQSRCELVVNFHSKSELRKCKDYTATCRDCQNQELVHACEKGFTQIVYFESPNNLFSKKNFKNIYCAICNMPGVVFSCGYKGNNILYARIYSEFSLDLLFDFNPVKESAVSLRQDPDDCLPGTEWLGVEIGCRAIECPLDDELEDNKCHLKLQYLRLSIAINVYLPSTDRRDAGNIDVFDGLMASVSAFYLNRKPKRSLQKIGLSLDCH